MSRAKSTDLAEISELIRPITEQCVLDVTGNKLIEALVLFFEFALERSNTTKSIIHLCHVLELHDDHPFGHVSDATETHLAPSDAIAVHLAFRDQVIEEPPHTIDPVRIRNIAFFVRPYSVKIHVMSFQENSLA